MKKVIIYSLALLFIGLFFSFRLLDVPLGLTVDEASFGYNGVLLSQTLHDENGRFLPVFVLSTSTKDWRQPITQYFVTGFFKIFGVSVFSLRLTPVVIVLVSAILIFFLGKILLNELVGIFAALFFLTTPLVMIQSHLALDNIMPVSFTALWLIFLVLFQKTKKNKYLILTGIFLGINFYTYKAMRAIVPVWFILTLVFLWQDSIKKYLKLAFYFVLGIAPFFLAMPLLEMKYPGSILAGQKLNLGSLYNLAYTYLSSFDPSFLFISGDTTIYHSTTHHGMFLLATIPLFIIGVYQSMRYKEFRFLAAAFFLAPLFFGLVDSVHRASRLMAIIPIYSLISALGFLWLVKSKVNFKRAAVFLLIFLMVINYFDFVKYYWFTYPKASETAFGKLIVYKSYEALARQSQQKNLTPYISQDVAHSEGESGHFFEAIYFGKLVNKWVNNEINPPEGSILLTTRDEIPGLKKLDLNLKYYRLQVNE